ncbi:MAG: metal-sensing transcriptional repressor [Bacteroides sp.]
MKNIKKEENNKIIKSGKIKEITKETTKDIAEEVIKEVTNDTINEASCCHKTKERSEKEYKSLINRLNRIEGQIRGIKGMIERDAYCTDILVQSAAVSAAVNAFNKELLANHIKSCVAEDIRAGKDEVIDELVVTLQKLMK